MSETDFDKIADRRRSDSEKWGIYAEDVIPLWVADMDFQAPEPVIQALQRRVDHGIFGYSKRPVALAEAVVERLERLYGWKALPDAVTFLPGVVPGFNLAARALARPEAELLIQTPVYPPFLTVAAHAGLGRRINTLDRRADGCWEIDFGSFAASLGRTTAAFLLCNPHNPVGRVFRRDELSTLAELCLREEVPVISDEIHSDLIFHGHAHIPFAALAPEVERKTITLMAPSKTFNIPGLECAFAVIPDAQLRRRFEDARAGLVPEANLLACTAALAAYRHGQAWLAAALDYLEANRNLLADFCRARVPEITLARPEGTYLAWLDCRRAELTMNPAAFFLERARVALSDGTSFGPGGDGFVRLNFGCPRPLLAEALERMETALQRCNC